MKLQNEVKEKTDGLGTSNEIIQAIIMFTTESEYSDWTKECELEWENGYNRESVVKIALTLCDENTDELVWGETSFPNPKYVEA